MRSFSRTLNSFWGWANTRTFLWKRQLHTCIWSVLHLVCFAYALLTHIAVTGEGVKAKRKPAVKLSTADLQNEARRIVWDDLAEHLKQLSSGTQVVKELERLLIAA
ncbi:MAG TPA: hypothetical protein PLX18_12660 [Anaerohalosphaeraceae bacterium]|nr:hypothetical protein [Anaerohalosphaeraceae bacterium]HQG07089.1 hypothetical protein [Anaerohalosphaeraceae bacterium]HQI08696.1 hypothetical protein [Anaerohalosphaeraceae bacterium]HQJ69023.1 hypothetical protein [Anaerohalosphaeraceae bacterium]